MEIGFVGLGKMGANMVRRLVQGGHQVHVFDRSANVAQDLQKEGAKARASLQELVSALPSPRVIWMMAPDSPDEAETSTGCPSFASARSRTDRLVTTWVSVGMSKPLPLPPPPAML